MTATSQIRLAHTDVKMPDFSAYRREAVVDAATNAKTSDAARKSFTYLVVGG